MIIPVLVVVVGEGRFCPNFWFSGPKEYFWTKILLISLNVVGQIFTKIFTSLRLFRQFSSILKNERVSAGMLSYIDN